MDTQQHALNHQIVRVLGGSHLYGTNTTRSDKDFVAVAMPHPTHILGMESFETCDIRTNSSASGHRNNAADVDVTIHSLPKFITLASGCNPNIVEMLFVPDNCKVITTGWWEQVLQVREAFIHKGAYHRFSGYAFSQRKKLEAKRQTWVLREELREKMEKLGLGLEEALVKARQGAQKLPGTTTEDLRWGSYLPIINDLLRCGESWRSELYSEHGYDTKFASHMIRLLHEGIELLTEGTIRLPLTHVREVLAIKEGQWSYEHVMDHADHLKQLADLAYVKSDLPKKPNLRVLEQLQMSLLVDYWKENNLWTSESSALLSTGNLSGPSPK